MSRKKSEPKKRPAPFSIGAWLARKETLESYQQWKSIAKQNAGLQEPASPTSGSASPVTSRDYSRRIDVDLFDLGVSEDDIREELQRRREETLAHELADLITQRMKEDEDWKGVLEFMRKRREQEAEATVWDEDRQGGMQARELKGDMTEVKAMLTTLAEAMKKFEEIAAGLGKFATKSDLEAHRRENRLVQMELANERVSRNPPYTCPECHVAVDGGVENCPSCGTPFEWSES